MTSYELLALGYFAVLVLVAPFTTVQRSRKLRAAVVSALTAAVVIAASRFLSGDARAWIPHLYLVAGYWVPPLLAPNPRPGFEAWLLRTDEPWRRFRVGGPRWAAHALELSYLLCYPVVPAAFFVVWAGGSARDIERFWMTVLAASFACYITIIAFVSRTPRLITAEDRHSSISSLNTAVLAFVSHQLNTFPSGHVAVMTAAALAVLPVWPAAGAGLGIMATCTAAGAFRGRYHFAMDVVFGGLVGILAAIGSSVFL